MTMEHPVDWEVLGYEVRVSRGELRQTWPPDRRRKFLLAPDIADVLSADPLAWPRDPQLEATRVSRPETAWYPRWLHLAEMKAAWKAAAFAGECIGTAVLLPAAPAAVVRDHPNAAPATVQDSWEFLGCDVADTGMTSALTNYGFLDEADRAERCSWAVEVNQFGLFQDPAWASEYAAFMQKLAPEHDGFLVVGLWVV